MLKSFPLIACDRRCGQTKTHASTWAYAMSLAPPEEFTHGNVLVRVYARPIGIPGRHGWVGVWSIYRLPGGAKPPVRIGDTDIEEDETVALGMARAIARAVALSL